MIRLYPKAAVLTAHHPYGGTEMMAQSLAFALSTNGYDAAIFNVNDESLQSLPALLKDPDLRLVMTTGTLPLGIGIGDRPVWDAVAPDVDFITYLIDAWPYDYVRVKPFRDYLRAWHDRSNLHLVHVEGNDARLIGDRVHHMPTGANPAPWRRGPKAHPERLMMWASTHTELAVSRFDMDFEETLAENNAWGFDAGRIRSIADALRATTITHGMSAIAEAMEMPAQALQRDEYMVALCAVDSSLKRYRRVKVVRALRDFPLDIYGRNWERYIEGNPNHRMCTANPDHNHAFSHVVQDYAGLINVDPNYGDGSNERAVSALAMGIPVANNFNLKTDPIPGCYPYHFTDESIRAAARRVLAHRGEINTPVVNTWEHQIGRLLRAIAASVVPA
ncbi:MAG: hypothetical protein WCG13_01560 [Burkholderiales bacterium]